ncbi:TetR/AcrR family transcriptional regulator [Mycolicibacterium arenosum]|uniref:TetR/AcrR family transcriptional regulator n=1 Tax=Mycolicibacterium arenosum TaxID=2952157 RepID=A0ABT1LXC5_9MYCO|nr:TetR/AcrR family transcriptional regulator [Mycolicibacterium sp. CAU 1645]MCP9271553.1 TetR/AcrR family transcriptional regulator [Mycolicibacterium sp. CAU 1645]
MTDRRPWWHAYPQPKLSFAKLFTHTGTLFDGDWPTIGIVSATSSRSAARSGGPRPSRREQILAAARAAIEQYGPGAITGQIAEHAGLARPNVYRHFASKDDLDLELARMAYRELRAAITSRLDLCGTPLEVVRAPIEAQATWADEHPNLYRFLVSRGHQRKRDDASRGAFAEELAAAGARYFPHFADDPDAAEATLVSVIGLVDASVMRWLDGRVEDRDRVVDRLTAQAWLLIDHHLREFDVHLDPAVPLPEERAEQG